MNADKTYVRTDEHGVMRIADTHVMLDSVVAAFEQGHSPETIAQQYPALTLEDVYGAITFLLANKELVAAYLSRQDAAWQLARANAGSGNAPVVQRLRDLASRAEVRAG